MAILALALPTVAVAQDNESQTIQAIVALVNDDLISIYDVQQRMGLLMASMRQRPTEEELLRMQDQVLQTMVDEKLQVQEAESFEIDVSEEELEQAFQRVARNFNQTPDQFDAYLAENRTSRMSLLQQIEAEIAWSTLVNGRLRPSVTIGDGDVEEVLARMEANAGQFEYRVGEIYLIVDRPDDEARVRDMGDRIIEQVRQGASFQNFARQFSQSATAAVGGDRGWVAEDQLVEELATVVVDLQVGSVADPVRAAGGFYLIALTDRRRILSLDPLDLQLTMKQVFYAFDEETTQENADALIETLKSEYATISSCDDIADFGTLTNATSTTDIGTLRLRDFPPELRMNLENLPIGSTTEPFGSQDGIRILAVCDRQEPEVHKPGFDEIYDQLEQQRLSMMSRRYLRDLRRNAIVDYR